MVKETSLYDQLEIKSDASTDDIKKAYKRLAIKYHPDKNKSPDASEKFKSISQAYEILSNPEKRQRYDQFGFDAVNQPTGEGFSPADIFAQFFGHNNQFFGQNPTAKNNNDIVIQCTLSLEELYTGTKKTISYEKRVKCETCQGSGVKDSKKTDTSTCKNCGGRGIQIVVHQQGPFIQQIQTICNNCRGKGKSVSQENQCYKCHGEQYNNEKTEKEITINAGMRHQQPIIISGEGHTPESNLVVVILEDDHERFDRQDDSLILKQTISLVEALTGFILTIDQLDGRKILVQSDDIIKPNDIYTIIGEGMPKGNQEKGDLFIVFDIQFPSSGEIDEDNFGQLRSILPAGKNRWIRDNNNEVIVKMHKFKSREEKRNQSSSAPPSGHQVQCAQQ